MPFRPAKATRTGCSGRARSLAVGTMIKMVLLLAAMSGSALPRAATEAAPVPATSESSASRERELRRHKKRQKEKTGPRHWSDDKRQDGPYVPVNEEGQLCLPSPLWERKVDPANYEFGCREIEEMLEGQQETASMHGRLRNVSVVEYQGEKFVIKILKQVEGERHMAMHVDMHNREVLTLDALAGHRNIVGMVGICGTTIVTKYYDAFTKTAYHHYRQPPIAEVLSMALDAARGLQALHEVAGSLHLDMKPEQFLVDATTGRVMLNDFNRAHFMSVSPTDGKYCPVEAQRRTRHTPWPSPENYAGEPLTEKADVYSMGMIFYMMVSGRKPYHGDVELLEAAFSHKTRPEVDPAWHRGFMEVVQEMWAVDPRERPYMGEVVARLEAMWAELGLPRKEPAIEQP